MSHIIFDVKLDAGFMWKDIFVADWHKVDMPPLMMYASVVSKDNVQILLILEDLNGLDLRCANVQNTYLNANPKEIVWFWSRQDFGVHKRKSVIVIINFYGLVGDGSAWASSLRQLIRDLGLNMCSTDIYVWMIVAVDRLHLGETTNDGLSSG